MQCRKILFPLINFFSLNFHLKCILYPNKVIPATWWRNSWGHSSFSTNLRVKDLQAAHIPQGSFQTHATAVPTPWKRNDPMFAASTQRDREGKLFFTAGTGGRGGMFQTEKPHGRNIWREEHGDQTAWEEGPVKWVRNYMEQS